MDSEASSMLKFNPMETSESTYLQDKKKQINIPQMHMMQTPNVDFLKKMNRMSSLCTLQNFKKQWKPQEVATETIVEKYRSPSKGQRQV
jgi:hypothetical protein